MKIKNTTIILAAAALLTACQTDRSLVPDKPSSAPDYFSTWNIQGYSVNYEYGPMVAAMDEQHLFGDGPLEGWCDFFPDFREDLIFLMDDSWDIPAGSHDNGNKEHMGSARLDESRFPSFKGDAVERLAGLTEKVKGKGWKGLGCWLCAQEASTEADKDNPQEYWKTRLIESQKAGVSYWKVDYGKMSGNGEWRKMLTRLSHEYAPSVMVEQASINNEVGNFDVFRTYDVEVVTSVPVTLQRIVTLLPYKAADGAGLINCEDEPYIAAGLGCAIGVMRHPLNGPLPNGNPDHAFPVGGRDVKSRLDEVNRSLKWHRIAEPFGVDDDAQIDSVLLQDAWVLGEYETWRAEHHPGDTLKKAAPARISRRMPLPEVECTSDEAPFVAASTYPNGAIAVATLERGIIHRSYTPEAIVTIEAGAQDAPIGIFGAYSALRIKYAEPIPAKARVLAQDLKGKKPVDITAEVEIKDNVLTISGDVIRKVGLMAATPGDKSEPGLVMTIR